MGTKAIIPDRKKKKFETLFLKKGTAAAVASGQPATLWFRLTQHGMQNEGML